MPSMLGFTFGFGAQDRGLKSAFGSVKDSLTNVSDQVSKLGGIAKNVNLGAMFSGFGMAGLSRISGQLDKIVGGNVNLVNGLESTMIASKKAARVIGAQAGMMGGDLDKFTSSAASLAYGMNLGIDQVAKAQKTYTRLSGDFRKGLNKSGIDLKAFLRAEEATGITSEDLMRSLNGLSGSFGFTGEQAGAFLDTFTATALAGGQGSVAFGTLKDTLDGLQTSLQQNADFVKLSADEQRKYVEAQIIGTQRLAGTLSKTLGVAPQEAQAAASAFAKKLNEEQTSIQKMLSGLGGEFGDLFTSISKETGMNVAEVFIGKSPDEALKMLLKIRERLSGMGTQGEMALSRLNSAFADIAPQMQIGLLDNEKAKEFSSNMDTIAASADKAKGSFDKFGKAAYTSGLSAADGVSRAKDAFESALLGIGGGAQGYANEQIKAYENVTKSVKKLSSDEAWGPLTKRFALATRIGMGAFFLPMKQEGDALKNQYANISESMGQGGLQGRFEAIRQLGVAGLFLDMGKASTDMGGAVDDAQSKTQALYEKFLQLKVAFDTFLPVIIAVAGALGVLFGGLKLMSAFGSAIGTVAAGMTAIASTGASAVMSLFSVGGAVIGLGKSVGSVVKKSATDQDGLLNSLGGALITPFEKTAQNLAGATPRITGAFSSVFGSLGLRIGALASSAGTAVGGTAIGGWIASMGASIAAAGTSVATFFAPVTAAFTSVVSSLMPILGAIFSGPVGWAVLAGIIIAGLVAMIGTMSDEMKQKILGFFDNIPDFALMLKDWAANLGTTIKNFVMNLPAMLMDLVTKLGTLVDSGGEFLMALADKIQFAVANFDFAGIITSFFTNLFSPSNVEGGFDWSGLLGSIMGLLFNAGKATWYVLKFVGTLFVTFATASLQAIVSLSSSLVQGIASMISSLASTALTGAKNLMLKGVNAAILGPINYVMGKMGKEPIKLFEVDTPDPARVRKDVKDVATAAASGAKDAAKKAATGAKEIGGNLVDAAKEKGAGLVGKVKGVGGEKIANLAGNLPLPDMGSMFSLGEGTMTATADGMKVGAEQAAQAMVEAQAQISNTLPKKGKPAPPTSPLVNIKDSGIEIMNSLANGMIDGTAGAVKAMNDAMLQIKEVLLIGITDVYNAMGAGFEEVGRQASQAFSRGVFLEQDLQLAELKQKLTDLLLGEFAGTIKVVDVAGEAGAATLSVDSAKTLTDQIVLLRETLVVPLRKIADNTENTDLNTRAMRGKAQSFALVASSAK